MIAKYTKSISLGVVLLATATLGYSQEFVVTQSQMNNNPACQENCQQEGLGNSAQHSSQHHAQNGAQSGGQNNTGIDRSGMDKASVHLQVLQQATPRFTESSNAKKPANEDKKSSTKTLDKS